MFEKQETYSVTEVMKFCATSKRLSGADIHMNDKTISWDGNIIYYENEKGKKTGAEYLIPVQIKGKCVNSMPETDKYKYSINVIDLDNFLKNWGVLYILGVIADDKVKLYMRLLLPVDISNIKAGLDDNQKSISTTLFHVASPDELEAICELYMKNCHKQSNFLFADKTFTADKIDRISVSLLKDSNSTLPSSLVRSKSAYVYGIINDIAKPLNFTFLEVSSDDKYYFIIEDSYADYFSVKKVCTRDTDTIIIQDALKLSHPINSQDVKITTEIDINLNFGGVYNAAKLICAFYENKRVFMDGNEIFSPQVDAEFSKKYALTLSKKFISNIKLIIELGDICDQLRIPKDEFITKDLLENEYHLRYLKDLLVNNHKIRLDIDEEYGLRNYEIAGKNIILQFDKCDDSLYILSNYLLSDSGRTFFYKNEDKVIKASKYLVIRPSNITKTIFNKDNMLQEIEKQEGLYHIQQVNSYVLEFIKDYDQTKNHKSLEFAEQLLSVIIEQQSDDPSLIINRIQIIKRKRNLSLNEKKTLTKLKFDTSRLLVCCACILLEQYDEFDMNFNLLPNVDQDDFVKWPIYHLYTKRDCNN